MMDGKKILMNGLEDKNYILSTSVLEGNPLGVMEGMARGLKPLIHNFVGAKLQFGKYIWNTIDEAVNMIKSNEYSSNEYRKYIVDNYSKEQQLCKIRQLLTKVISDKKNNRVLIEEEPLVTVGIISYNNSRFLAKCIESVLNQTYKNIELIIIDDCSVDDSIEQIKLYEKKYSNIRAIFHEGNSGSPDRAIQETISEAKGKYLMWLSSDDYLATETAIYDFINNLVNDSELDYVYCNLKIVDIDGTYKNIWRYKQYSPEEIIECTFNRSGSGIIPINAGVYKTDFYRKNNLNWHEDKNNISANDTLNVFDRCKE